MTKMLLVSLLQLYELKAKTAHSNTLLAVRIRQIDYFILGLGYTSVTIL